jgi:sensor domain CHASE-containing protein
MAAFKVTAFGDKIEDAQAKIEKEINEKYSAIKTRFKRDYNKQVIEQIKGLMQPLESKIRLNQYKCP